MTENDCEEVCLKVWCCGKLWSCLTISHHPKNPDAGSNEAPRVAFPSFSGHVWFEFRPFLGFDLQGWAFGLSGSAISEPFRLRVFSNRENHLLLSLYIILYCGRRGPTIIEYQLWSFQYSAFSSEGSAAKQFINDYSWSGQKPKSRTTAVNYTKCSSMLIEIWSHLEPEMVFWNAWKLASLHWKLRSPIVHW